MAAFTSINEEVFNWDSEYRLNTPEIIKAITNGEPLTLRARLGVSNNYNLMGYGIFFREIMRNGLEAASEPKLTKGYFETEVTVDGYKATAAGKLELNMLLDEDAAKEANIPLRGLNAFLAGNNRRFSVWQGGSIDGLEILNRHRPNEGVIDPRRAASAYFLKSIEEIVGDGPALDVDEPEPIFT